MNEGRRPSIENQTIAEVGPGTLPVFYIFDNENFRNIGKDSKYIAIDCNQEELDKFIKHFKEEGREAKLGDLENLPLDNDSVDQMWLMNVFGGLESPPKILPDGTRQWTLGVQGIFKELARVVKQNGKIYIGEIYPPKGEVTGLIDKDYTKFGLEKETYKGPEETESFLKKMGGNNAIIDHMKCDTNKFTPFFVVLTKIKPQTI